MRQETAGEKRGTKSVWDDPERLQTLYAEFGEGEEGERRFNALLSKLSLMSDWGEIAAEVIRARQEGHTTYEVAQMFGFSNITRVRRLEKSALGVLREMRSVEYPALPQIGVAGKTILHNPQGIVERYGGEQEFHRLLQNLRGIKFYNAPEWGERLADVLERLLIGDSRRKIGRDFNFSSDYIGVLGHQALEALDALATGEEVGPVLRRDGGGSRLENRVAVVLRRYGKEEEFWRLIQQFEQIFWQQFDAREFDNANQVAEGLAILRAHAQGKTLEEIGLALGGGEPFEPLSRWRVGQLEAWALDNLDRLYRGEKVQFRASGGRPRKE